MSRGISTNRRVSSQAGCLQGNGITYVCRYYSTTTSQSEKRLTPEEANAIHNAGMAIVTVYEDGPTNGGYFRYARGMQDGIRAHGYATALGQPAASAIYFAVDYDATTATTQGAITQYFQAVKAALAQAAGGATGYQIGVYGSGRVCAWIKENQGLAQFSWLAESHGWAGHSSYTNPDIRQEVAHGTLCELIGGVGGDYEDNFAGTNFGAFMALGGMATGVGGGGPGENVAAGSGAAPGVAAAGAAAYAQAVAQLARQQYEDFHQYTEDDATLRDQIRRYWEEIGFDFPGTGTAWSAVFVSWILRTAGANETEWKSSTAHSRFVFWAIENRRDGTGLFWAHRLETYAPKAGDVIHNNRNGQTVTYDFAAAHQAYESHSAVVVEIGSDVDGRFAMTVGGNEGNSVGRKRVALDSNGLVRQRETNPFICVIENRKA